MFWNFSSIHFYNHWNANTTTMALHGIQQKLKNSHFPTTSFEHFNCFWCWTNKDGHFAFGDKNIRIPCNNSRSTWMQPEFQTNIPSSVSFNFFHWRCLLLPYDEADNVVRKIVFFCNWNGWAVQNGKPENSNKLNNCIISLHKKN